ncbi:MAG TPA: class I SAM-dependent methyltransferase [Polyangiaceae bacterium]|nr:class I SAM-dependent methyltransferase [Polyangiaceae bacterium]
MTASTSRFSDRVADYVKYRPGYPDAAIDAIIATAHPKTIADIGSGTGISSRPFVKRGVDVVGVEPNAEMRAAADGFRTVDGTAEKTGLPDESVDLAIAAQAFHWFKSDEARAEMKRITKPPHWAVLMWNERLTDTAFLRDYEAALFVHGIDYDKVDHRNVDREKLAAFFRAPFDTIEFPNVQRFDRTGVVGRALSSSYVPQKGHEKYDGMMRALDRVFDAHAVDGFVDFRYLTFVHVGQLV